MSEFFAPLLEPKPMARLKLLAAWDGLSLESQMKIVTLATKSRTSLPEDIARKALSSPNARWGQS
jgi:hypothetical protein